MEQLHVNLVLDREMLSRVIGYYMYRSQETERGRQQLMGYTFNVKQSVRIHQST